MTTKLVQTVMTDHRTGEPLYVLVTIRPKIYYHYKRIMLFVGIVLRDFHGVRIGVKTAWSVACGIYERELKTDKKQDPTP